MSQSRRIEKLFEIRIKRVIVCAKLVELSSSTDKNVKNVFDILFQMIYISKYENTFQVSSDFIFLQPTLKKNYVC